MYSAVFQQMQKQLGQLDLWLEAATQFAASKSFDANLFVGFRLAPDQFGFGRQVQVACDTAKLAAARLTGQEAPKHDDTEQTLDQLRTRVRAVIEYLNGVTPATLADAATRVISQPRWEGKTMTGADYFVQHAMPNFFFHIGHAYAILRHNGVPLGKRDYLGALTFQPKAE